MKIWASIATGLVKRGGAVLISIRDAVGSTPRETGTQMVVFGDGTFTGTIGGGTLEWRAIAEAQRLLSRPPSSPDIVGDADLVSHVDERSYALGPELGQCCGGRLTLAFELFSKGSLPVLDHFAALQNDGTLQLVREQLGSWLTRRLPSQVEPSSTNCELETFGADRRRIILFGAGHVGRALVLALSALPFDVTWVDSRPDAFPAAVPPNVRLVRPDQPLEVLAASASDSFVVIMTHSHELDFALCDAALRAGHFPYVGMIGSDTKRARFESRLRSAGISTDAIDRFVCPIAANGPKSKLPAAIAASIVVELLVKDETCLKVASAASNDRAIAATHAVRVARGQSGVR